MTPTNQDSPNTAGAAELKVCPFCGGEKARTIRIHDGGKVVCICGACGKPEFHGPLDRPDAEARAIAAWNTRADNPPQRPSVVPDEVVEAVAKAAIDRAIARLQNLRDYAGRPAWDEVIRQEMRTALTKYWKGIGREG